ncbi:MAG: hypothetical protein WCJ35_06895 [Planctomycetota bacterium]
MTRHMRHIMFGLLSGILIATTVRGAADPVTIREVYWQVLPVGWVYADHAGRPWFPTVNGDVALSAGRETGQLAADQILLLGDRAGRIWVNQRYRSNPPTRYFDGKSWHDTGIQARGAFEDSTGRVFLADVTHVHVLDGATWSKQQVFQQRRAADGHFAEDSQGRVWFWAVAYHGGHWGEYPGTRGIWCYDRGKWMNYNQDSGLAVEDIAALVPLSDDRFLVLGTLDKKANKNQCVGWSPSQKPIAGVQDFFSLKPSGRIRYLGVDLDSLHHFDAEGLKVDDAVSFDTRGRVVVLPRGAAKVLSKAEAERAAQLPVGLYENRGRILGRLSEIPPTAPCQPGEAICRDRLGRIYFRYHDRVGVVWPKFEKPGDMVRLQSDSAQVQPLFQTRDGTIWGMPRGIERDLWGKPRDEQVSLVCWDGRRWEDTPVKTLPHPRWTAHPTPPWDRWARSPLFLSGGDTVLAVVVRDIYQDMQAAAKGKELDDWRQIERTGREQSGVGGKTTWYEAWMYDGGNWSGPEKLPTLIEKRWAVLAEKYQQPARRGEWLAVQGDGHKRLWVAYDSTVSALDQDGVKQWTVPNDSQQAAGYYQFCRLPDGRMLLSAHLKGLWALSVTDGKIVAEKFSAPECNMPYYRLQSPAAFVARDKSLWMTSGDYLVWRFRDGRWEQRKDLAFFLFEDGDGSLWFRPGEESKFGPTRGYRLVKGNQTTTFPWPAEYEFGDLTPTHDGRLLAACGYWIVQLDKADESQKRPITKARIADRYLGGSRVFVADDGTVFANTYLGK